jgi:hypothetical protein
MRLKPNLTFEPNLCVLWDEAIVTLAITSETEQSFSQTASTFPARMIKIRLIDPTLTQQLRAMPDALNYHCLVSDPAILHLVQLLRTEVQNRQPMSPMAVSSIAIVLATHLLQHWQAST